MKGKLIRESRRKDAEERQKIYDSLTIEQKIAKLDKVFGEGLGAKKERAKLQKKLGTVKVKAPKKKEDKKINNKDKKTSSKGKKK